MGGCDMDFIGLLRTLEQITRPAGHDDDRPFAEEEVSEARCDCCEHPTAPELLKSGDDGESWCCPDCVTEALASEAEWRAINGDDDEPGLTPDELVAVRQLIDERFPIFAGAAASLADERFIQPSAGVSSFGSSSVREDKQQEPTEPADPHKTSASNHAGTSAEPAPSPTIVQSAPPPTVDGEGSPADSGIPPSPAGERPPHPVPREQRIGTYCEDYETDGCSVDVCPDGCYHALKFRDDAVAEWIGGAVPVICGVLARHVPVNTSKHTPSVFCNSITGQYCHEYADWQAWREHIAPILANALAPQDK